MFKSSHVGSNVQKGMHEKKVCRNCVQRREVVTPYSITARYSEIRIATA